MYLHEHTDFDDLIEQVSVARKMPFAFIEKDYWITYTLYRMKKAGIDDFIFKGGTSLTKGWGLLERFSEDIDLLFIPATLTRDQKRNRLKKVQSIVLGFEGLVHDQENSKSYGHYRVDSLKYVIKRSSTLGILLPYIKLEMGYRGGDVPTNDLEIQSYVGKALTDAKQLLEIEDIHTFKIKILDSRRTFVEKIFAIYTAYEEKEVQKYFRHYYDLYKLLGQAIVVEYLGSPEFLELKKHVAEMSVEFSKTKFPDDLNFSSSNAFVRSDELINELQKAINNGKGLFFVAPPKAEEILIRIEEYRQKF